MNSCRRIFTALTAVLLLATLYQIASLNDQNSGQNEFFRQASRDTYNSRQTRSLRRSPRDLESYYAEQLDNLPINFRPGFEHRQDSTPTPNTEKRCKSIVYQTLLKLPYSHRQQLEQLTLFYTKDGRRGLGGDGGIVLRCLNITDVELSSVFVHEMGHLVDADLLSGTYGNKTNFYDFEMPILADDASLMFYEINWISDKTKLANSVVQDFVSLYAMSDPFEDFAETYTYYRLHGPEFRGLARFNGRLAQKYEFFRMYVFGGEEFGDLNLNPTMNVYLRNYDVTVLPLTS